jgi:hypothetical protein
VPRVRASTKDVIVKADISTLYPELLQETDYLDLSSKFTLALWSRQVGKLLGYKRASITYDPRDTQPFPPGSHGFLYYTTPPGLPPTAGEIRFRITPTSSPASFNQGTDLLAPYGMPWRIQVLSRISSLSWESLVDVLLRDSQITHFVLSEMKAIVGPGRQTKPMNCFFSLEQPFPYNFSTRMDAFCTVVKGKLAKFVTTNLLSEAENRRVLCSSWLHAVTNQPLA